ncbi:hypothetical protein AK812_SmicGene9758 [Symbiodinium microadriaticum]|uniref:Uncharacterized protein n=1 Tax=Symbiodinium microadriaticum TaxID=2951 RepID=A0A1Q9EHJ3_SYMMI|nr:hypothetical protein AK812_SmicGene9758 [Symbiodinium microadriaticum]
MTSSLILPDCSAANLQLVAAVWWGRWQVLARDVSSEMNDCETEADGGAGKLVSREPGVEGGQGRDEKSEAKRWSVPPAMLVFRGARSIEAPLTLFLLLLYATAGAIRLALDWKFDARAHAWQYCFAAEQRPRCITEIRPDFFHKGLDCCPYCPA